MDHVHKRFSDEQVVFLLQKYSTAVERLGAPCRTRQLAGGLPPLKGTSLVAHPPPSGSIPRVRHTAQTAG